MSRVVAAVDRSAAVRPVLSVAGELSRLVGAQVEAVHVREEGDRPPDGEALAAGAVLREVEDPVVESLLRAARPADVEAVVIGARGTPGGRRPVGGTALELITRLEKLLVVVPPNALHPGRLERVLVPLDGTPETAAALRRTIEIARGGELDVVVLHVLEETSLPLFEDQPQHETAVWVAEFLARECPAPAEELRMELRVGAPDDWVVRVAEEADADLIALGWSRNLSEGRARVVRATLTASRVPVLLVPAGTASRKSEKRRLRLPPLSLL
jgi:nucleotide-binding universal stress UspA family protein